MIRLLLAAAVAASLTACGAAPTALKAPASAASAMAATPFAELKDVKVVEGAPSDWWEKTTRRHVSARTLKNGTVWVLDSTKGVEVLHNTQTVTNAKKLEQVATALEKAAAAAADTKQATQLREFVALLRAAR
jgi:hypothetical protein